MTDCVRSFTVANTETKQYGISSRPTGTKIPLLIMPLDTQIILGLACNIMDSVSINQSSTP